MSFAEQAQLREAKIIKSTMNRVLAPKISMNTFLESPLMLDNYYFAGTLKLGYIDRFLNNLKNRAVAVELP